MKKKLLTLFLAICATICLCFGLTACDETEHTHTYATEWTNDETYHWHAATCEHSDEVSEKGEHSFVDGICSVCGYNNGTGHTHVYNQPVAEEEYLKSKANCKAKAVYYYSCSCGEKGTDTFEFGDVGDHIPTSANNGVAATCTTMGKESDTVCSVCGETLTMGAEIPLAAHNYVDGVCSVCGYGNGSSTFYYNILESLVEQGGFSIVLDTDNTSFTYTSPYGDTVITFNVGEVTCKFDEYGNITEAWINGEVNEAGWVSGIECYLKDGVYYVKINDGDYYSDWIKMSADDMMAAETDEATALAFKIVRNITPGLVALSNKVLSDNSVWINGVLEKVFGSIFTRQTADGEVTLSLDGNALKATYKMISSSTISEVIDYYLGSGTYAWVQTLVSGFDKLTLEQIITSAENFTNISRAEVIKIINDACAAAGYEINVSDYLTDEVLALTVDEIVSNYIGDETFALSEVAGSYLEQLKDLTLFELLESLGVDTTAIPQNAEYYIELAAKIFDVKLITDEQGNLNRVDISVNYDGEFEPDEDEHCILTGGLQIVNGGETDNSFVSELVEEVDELYDNLYDNILVDGNRINNIFYELVDYDATVENNSYAVVHIADDGTVSLTVNCDVKITSTNNDGYYIGIETYKGTYVLTYEMCVVQTVVRYGELVEGVYLYNIMGTAAEGSSISYTYTWAYYENGEWFGDSYSGDVDPDTSIYYYYPETAE